MRFLFFRQPLVLFGTLSFYLALWYFKLLSNPLVLLVNIQLHLGFCQRFATFSQFCYSAFHQPFATSSLLFLLLAIILLHSTFQLVFCYCHLSVSMFFLFSKYFAPFNNSVSAPSAEFSIHAAFSQKVSNSFRLHQVSAALELHLAFFKPKLFHCFKPIMKVFLFMSTC